MSDVVLHKKVSVERCLRQVGVLDAELARRLRAMVGFRNVLVHQYTQLDPAILVDVVEHRGADLLVFAAAAVKAVSPSP
ncbi:MAG: DUF86 domain-containing protein [Porticoccaceae bacterium]|nr:MAG: DUF86 domain-containing protein [Porticoccaceae bacterium]